MAERGEIFDEAAIMCLTLGRVISKSLIVVTIFTGKTCQGRPDKGLKKKIFGFPLAG
jgi:hypothetical protein